MQRPLEAPCVGVGDCCHVGEGATPWSGAVADGGAELFCEC